MGVPLGSTVTVTVLVSAVVEAMVPVATPLASVTAAADVDAVFVHGPHVVQPFEFVNGTPVWWSLGNFVWPRLSVAPSLRNYS